VLKTNNNFKPIPFTSAFSELIFVTQHAKQGMKKLKFLPDDLPDIEMIGINTDLHDYRLAYFINKETQLNLERLDDLPAFNEKQKILMNYCLYSWFDADQRLHYYLIGNNNYQGKLIEAYSQANYFILIKGKSVNSNMKQMTKVLRSIPMVTFVFVPIISKIKELSGMLQDLEIHELNQNTRNRLA
jgi:hypothetical protein